MMHDHLSRRLAVSMIAAEFLPFFSQKGAIAGQLEGRHMMLHLPPFPHLIVSDCPVLSLDPPQCD